MPYQSPLNSPPSPPSPHPLLLGVRAAAGQPAAALAGHPLPALHVASQRRHVLRRVRLALPPVYFCNTLPSYKTADCHPVVQRNVRFSFLGAMLWALAVLSWAV
jgi:hypothetical protein